MALTKKQTGVLKGIVIGMTIAVSIIIIGAWHNPFSLDESLGKIERIEIAIKSAFLPVIFFVISIARLAKHRFFTPEDIDGGAGLSEDTEHARFLQSLLQNT